MSVGLSGGCILARGLGLADPAVQFDVYFVGLSVPPPIDLEMLWLAAWGTARFEARRAYRFQGDGRIGRLVVLMIRLFLVLRGARAPFGLKARHLELGRLHVGL